MYKWVPQLFIAISMQVVMILVIGVHLCYFQRTQLVTRIFVMLCVSVFLYQVMHTRYHVLEVLLVAAVDVASVGVCQ